jgi:hypothetical protein
MRLSRDHDAIESYSDNLMRRETRRCLWIVAAIIGSFTLALTVVTL